MEVLDNSYFQNILDLDYQLHEKGMPSAYGEGENENSSQGGKQSNVWYRAALKEAPGGFVCKLIFLHFRLLACFCIFGSYFFP